MAFSVVAAYEYPDSCCGAECGGAWWDGEVVVFGEFDVVGVVFVELG